MARTVGGNQKPGPSGADRYRAAAVDGWVEFERTAQDSRYEYRVVASEGRDPLAVQDPIEVERLVWARLQGPGSLTDPVVQVRGRLEGRDVGPAFDLPGDAFVWGFTAMILARVIEGAGLHRPRAGAAVREIPAHRRRTGRERL